MCTLIAAAIYVRRPPLPLLATPVKREIIPNINAQVLRVFWGAQIHVNN